jgi:hypothetical protein
LIEPQDRDVEPGVRVDRANVKTSVVGEIARGVHRFSDTRRSAGTRRVVVGAGPESGGVIDPSDPATRPSPVQAVPGGDHQVRADERGGARTVLAQTSNLDDGVVERNVRVVVLSRRSSQRFDMLALAALELADTSGRGQPPKNGCSKPRHPVLRS